MSKIVPVKNQNLAKQKEKNLLSNVTYENGFHFYTEVGKYSGVTATSLAEFADKLKTIPIQSVNFHFKRQDFQKWLKTTIGDEELARRIDSIKTTLTDENLRKELFKTIQNRITEITKP